MKIMFRLLYFLASLTFIVQNESARILAVFPTPLLSHQSVYRAIIHELLHRDHEVVLITPLPEYPRGQSPDNLMEIDVSNVTKEVWERRYVQAATGKTEYSIGGLKHVLQVIAKVVEKQFQIPQLKHFIRNNETFDLLLLEAWIRPTLFWTYIYDAPVVSVNSFGPVFNDYTNMGGPAHPFLYPTSLRIELQDKNLWQKLVALYEYWKLNSIYNSLEEEEDEMAKRLFGNVPPLKEQVERIELLLLNIHPLWQGIRPVPMNVVHLGGTHLQDREKKTKMTEELKEYLDSCINGLVYVSFGTNTRPRLIPKQTQRLLIQAFSKVRFPVLWKWDDDISGLPSNVRVGKWFPQAEVLKHPNVRLFISQCGQQSTDEAIDTAVPVLALPLAADQWHNAAQLLRHNVGATLDLENVEVEHLKNIIENTMRNQSYRNNMQRLREFMFDAPAPAPERAANAIEYVLRHTAGQIASPSRYVHWFQYMEIELIIIVTIIICISVFVLLKILYCAFRKMVRRFTMRRIAIDVLKNKV